MSEPQMDLTGSRILAVDDVPANLDVLLETLEEAGYEVLVANDGETALGVAANARPDLILLDVMMPGIDGFETCRRFKADPSLREVPVIFLTARDDIESVVEGFDTGGIDYVVKPFEKREVLARIRTHLERDRLSRDLAELNAHLEDLVLERTRQLRLKVRELEGKDRIAQHLLTFHTLEETLELVLEVVCEILALDRAAIYLVADEQMKAAAAIGYFEPGERVPSERLEQLPLGPEHKRVFDAVRRHGQSTKVERAAGPADGPFAVAPILRHTTLLGLIRVDKLADGHGPVTDAELRTLDSFALQAAVAINDAQVRQDPAAWRDTLDNMLDLDEGTGEMPSENTGDRRV